MDSYDEVATDEAMVVEEMPVEETEKPAPGFEALYDVAGIVTGGWLVSRRRQE